MRLEVDFILIPTQELVEAAALVAEAQLVEASVWTTHVTDRTGLDHSKEEIQDAFWVLFQANLIFDQETALQRAFRERCNELGFSRCWTVIQTMGGGSAEELMDAADDARDFLRGRD